MGLRWGLPSDAPAPRRARPSCPAWSLQRSACARPSAACTAWLPRLRTRQATQQLPRPSRIVPSGPCAADLGCLRYHGIACCKMTSSLQREPGASACRKGRKERDTRCVLVLGWNLHLPCTPTKSSDTRQAKASACKMMSARLASRGLARVRCLTIYAAAQRVTHISALS